MAGERAIGKSEILRLINEGWELGCDDALHPQAWMQKRLGHGGESVRARVDSAYAVIRSGAVVSAGAGPGISTRYVRAAPSRVAVPAERGEA